MVHCDVKPANILIDKTGHVFVSDFGIARLTETATTTTTMVGAGTPAYMSPEQARGDNPAPQTDIYALGIMLFEVLTGGERPFTGDLAQTTGSTSEKVRWEQMNLRPPSPRKWNPQIAPEVEAVVLRCLDKERARRYASTPEMLAALEQALSQQPRYIPVPVPPEPPHPTPANSRRSRRKQATAAAFVFIGLITIGYVLLGSPTGQGPLLWSATPVLTSMPTPTYTDTPTLPPEAVATLDLSAANQGTAMTPAAPAATGGNVHHIVKPGETLFSIGHQHNVNPYVIAAANNIPYPYIIYLGQQLVIPTDSTPTEMTPTYTSTAISTATPSRTQTYTTTATDTPSSTPTKTRLRPTLPIRTNTPTPIPIPIDTPTPVPAFTVIFTAKSNTISPGQCATVHWEVYGVQAILYQDQWEVWAGDRIECPGSTTTYKLTVQLYSGEYRDYFVTVSVQ
jgi:serine/threonine protein kinase